MRSEMQYRLSLYLNNPILRNPSFNKGAGHIMLDLLPEIFLFSFLQFLYQAWLLK
jgi:hypothetical protein